MTLFWSALAEGVGWETTTIVLIFSQIQIQLRPLAFAPKKLYELVKNELWFYTAISSGSATRSASSVVRLTNYSVRINSVYVTGIKIINVINAEFCDHNEF